MNDFQRGYQKGLQKVFMVLESLLNEGIDIRDFSKLSDEPTFQKYCRIFKDRIKNDDEAKKYAELSNLNIYKNDFGDFIQQVKKAMEFMESRKRNKSSRKAKGLKGIDIVYEDERCFIVSPKAPEYSHKAAYLDGATAPWCIASPPDKAWEYWKIHDVEMVFYIYFKGDETRENYSWAFVLASQDIEDILQNSIKNERAFGQIQTRKNDMGEEREVQMPIFYDMLETVGMTVERFYGILRHYLNTLEK